MIKIKTIKYNIKQYTYIFFNKKYLKRIKKYGLKYIIDIHYRSKCNRKEIAKKQLKSRGNFNIRQKNKIRNYCNEKQGGKCFWCKNTFKKWEIKTIDHIIPVCICGTNKKDNYQIIHNDCRIERDKLFKIFNIILWC